MKKDLVILLTKYPEPGKVKTRLGKSIGLKKASNIQSLFIKELLKNNYSNKSFDFKIGLRGKENIKKFSSYFLVNRKHIFIQVGKELGSIMNYCIGYGLKSYEKVIIIGSDIPQLNKVDFNRGFTILEEKNIVIGRANDGGYYLIGMKKEYKYLFENIEYSTETVFEETINKINKNNLSFGLLDEKIDIDTKDDLTLALKKDKTGFLTKILKECEIKM